MSSRHWAVLISLGILCECGAPDRYAAQAPSLTSVTSTVGIADAIGTQPSACDQFAETKMRLANLSEIASVFRGGDFKKQEFETTDQFKARLASRITSANQRANLEGDIFYFAIPIPADEIKFDADQDRMIVGDEYLGLFGLHTGFGKGELNVTSSRHTVGSYVGQNSFGVKKEIVRLDEQKLDVQVPGGEYSTWPSNFRQVVFYTDRGEARKIKENLVVLFAGRFKAPYFTSETTHFTPKIDAPYDITTHTEVIHLDVDCAAIFDKARRKKITDLSLASQN